MCNPWIGICVALLLGIAIGFLFSRKEPAPAPVAAPAATEPGGKLELKLERDLASFSLRLKEKR